MSCTKDPETSDSRKIIVWPQWLAAFALSLETIVSGISNGWSSPYLAQLTSAEADIALKLTDIEASWVASFLSLGRGIGAVFGAFCQEYIGLKKVLLLSSLPLLSGWIFNICTTSVVWLYLSRFSLGIGSGIMWPALSLYLGEIANPAIRGSLISLSMIAAAIGLLLGNTMGPYLSMEMFSYVSLVPNILFIVLFSLIPESPYHYALHGNIDEAEVSLKWFRREADIKAEMRELQDFVDGANTNILMKLKDFILPANLKNVCMMFGLNIFVQASLYHTVNSYAEIIITKAKVDITPSIVVMALCLATIVAGFIGLLLVDRFGRKNLLILSSTGVTISLGTLGLHFYLLSLNFDSKNLTWLPIASLLSFNLFVNCGLSMVPSTLLGELFPANLKNLASLVIFSGNALLTFVFVKSYQPFVDLAGETIVFWSSGLFVFGTVPYVLYLMPETTGKSLLEIQQSIKK